MQRLG
ncbi:hypothetical protein RJ640_021835 [Escallonia rubra]